MNGERPEAKQEVAITEWKKQEKQLKEISGTLETLEQTKAEIEQKLALLKQKESNSFNLKKVEIELEDINQNIKYLERLYEQTIDSTDNWKVQLQNLRAMPTDILPKRLEKISKKPWKVLGTRFDIFETGESTFSPSLLALFVAALAGVFAAVFMFAGIATGSATIAIISASIIPTIVVTYCAAIFIDIDRNRKILKKTNFRKLISDTLEKKYNQKANLLEQKHQLSSVTEMLKTENVSDLEEQLNLVNESITEMTIKKLNALQEYIRLMDTEVIEKAVSQNLSSTSETISNQDNPEQSHVKTLNKFGNKH